MEFYQSYGNILKNNREKMQITSLLSFSENCQRFQVSHISRISFILHFSFSICRRFIQNELFLSHFHLLCLVSIFPQITLEHALVFIDFIISFIDLVIFYFPIRSRVYFLGIVEGLVWYKLAVRVQISLLILSKFKRTNSLHGFSDDFSGYRS